MHGLKCWMEKGIPAHPFLVTVATPPSPSLHDIHTHSLGSSRSIFFPPFVFANQTFWVLISNNVHEIGLQINLVWSFLKACATPPWTQNGWEMILFIFKEVKKKKLKICYLFIFYGFSLVGVLVGVFVVFLRYKKNKKKNLY